MRESKLLLLSCQSNAYKSRQLIKKEKGKFVLEEFTDFGEEIDPYLNDGWEITNISVNNAIVQHDKALGFDHSSAFMVHLYVLLTREKVEKLPVKPTLADEPGYVICPNCGMKCKSNWTFCYKCNTKFQ